MADAVKISSLPDVTVGSFGKQDHFIVNDVSEDSVGVTRKISVGSFVNWITTQELSFDNIEVNNITPGPGGLNVTVDGIYIKDDITVGPGADISGIKLDHLDDVDIDTGLLDQGDALVWDEQKGVWTNGEGGFRDAPNDGRTYGRKNGEWIDITDCLRCPGDGNIGNVSIKKLSSGDVVIGDIVSFRAEVSGTADNLFYQWTITPSTFTSSDSTSNTIEVTFQEAKDYRLNVRVSGDIPDSPQEAEYLVTALSSPKDPEDSYNLLSDPLLQKIITENGVYINTEFVPRGTPIGIFNITRLTDGDIKYGQEYRYEATIANGAPSDVTYAWNVSSGAVISNEDKKVCTVKYVSGTNFTLTCEVTAFQSPDSPQVRNISAEFGTFVDEFESNSLTPGKGTTYVVPFNISRLLNT